MDHKRQIEIYNPEDYNLPVTIIGVGNIGSQTAVALARLGITDFTVFDHDTVEPHNLSSQSYFHDDLGKLKVDSLREQISKINPDALTIAKGKKYEGENLDGEIIIIAVDSMAERRSIAELIEKETKTPTFIIDGRVGGPQLEIYTCDTVEEWKGTFVDNPSDDPCGARYICYISMVIGSLIANQIKRKLKSENLKKEIIFNLDTLDLIKT